MPSADTGDHWYSVTEGQPASGGTNFVAQTQQELEAYFAARFRAGELLSLAMADVALSNRPGRAAIGFVITRDADDLPPTLGGPHRLAQGKAEIDCERQRFLVWSMAQNLGSSEDVIESWPCPKPPGWTMRPAIVCARGGL